MAKMRIHLRRFYDHLFDYMHQNCYELLISERYDKSDQDHIKMMKNFNTKKVNKDELYEYLGKRSSTNTQIPDEEIANILSNKDAMILAADNASCDQINCFMARVQCNDQNQDKMSEHKESKVYLANYYRGIEKINATDELLKMKFDKVNYAIRLGPNCKVNLSINIDVKLGLTNRSSGIVRKIVKSKDPKDPDIILVEIAD